MKASHPQMCFSTRPMVSNSITGKWTLTLPKIAMGLLSHKYVLFLTFTSGLISMMWGINPSAAFAQISSPTSGTILSQSTLSQVNVLFVNPSSGNDSTGNGGTRTPFKTITKALKVAKPGTIIRLHSGTYSAETGENFPIILSSDISIQGNVSNKGRNIFIKGGGDYLSRYYGSKNIAIVGASGASIAGVTVTNPNPRGYGMWIESGKPIIEENTFTSNTQDGVAITGSAQPVIRRNNFYRNGANGITISGASRPEIRENEFQNTGYGINIAQNASPQVIGNRISANRSGIIVQASSRPVLRNNIIEGNLEDGLVVISQAMPDLGRAQQPGGNQFRANRRYDINASAAKQTIPAYGNTLATNSIAGNVDTRAIAAPVAPAGNTNTRIAKLEQLTSKLKPVPTAVSTTDTQINYVQVDPDTIEFTAPTTPLASVASDTEFSKDNSTSLPQLQAAAINESALLGNFQPQPASTQKPPLADNPPQIAYQQTNVRYRVLVDAPTLKEQEIVRKLAPNAFRTKKQGKVFMQVGVFNSRQNAGSIVRKLNSSGIRTIVEPLK